VTKVKTHEGGFSPFLKGAPPFGKGGQGGLGGFGCNDFVLSWREGQRREGLPFSPPLSWYTPAQDEVRNSPPKDFRWILQT